MTSSVLLAAAGGDPFGPAMLAEPYPHYNTDVLIDYLRARAEAVAYIESLTDPLSMSAITVAELYTGVRDGAERTALEAFIRAFLIRPFSHEIAVKGGLYRRDYSKSH